MRSRRSIVFALLAATELFVPPMAWAGFTDYSIVTSNGRRTLENGHVYLVKEDFTVKGGMGQSAFSVAENSTVVLYIASGVTLKLTGGSGSETKGAGAGIEIPSSSTLVVTGGGTLTATGGKGASGSNGGDGENANVDGDGKPHDDWGRAGVGGDGGSGGGGAGAGIGGNGGSGGAGRVEPRKASNWHNTNGDWQCRGYDGYSGYSGSNGKDGGNIYVLGTVNVTATGGAAGSNGGAGGSNGSKDKEYWTLSYRAGGGGGGGGGGSGCAASAFGGGGGGGGAGGGGGEGSRYRTTQGYTYRSANGGHGGGGSGGVSGGGTRTDGEDGWFVGTGGNGGSGGSKGSSGSGGSAYKANGATFSGPSSTTAAETHYAIEYKLTFDDGWRITTNKTVKFGYALPQGPMTSRFGYIFKGWYTERDGGGKRYYDENGNAVVGVWTNAGDLTLYPRWDRNTQEDLGEVTLYVNNTPVAEGTSCTGEGWGYDSAKGEIKITGAGRTYDIRGRDLRGFAQILVDCDCTIQVSQTLEMQPGSRDGYNPIRIADGRSVTFNVTDAYHADAECDLTGAEGRTAIRVPSTSTLTLKTTGVFIPTGGDGAADIGLDRNDSSGGDIYVEMYSNWTANIRPGHGNLPNNGLVNESGKSARFRSLATSNEVWSVRMTDLDTSEATKRMYLQRVEGNIHDDIRPDWSGNAWLWMPKGGYEWAEELNASLRSNNLWVCYVDGVHSAAEFFSPLYIEIDGEDIAHLTGKGWYATRTSGTNENSKATLVITNAGPHVVYGYGNACIEVMCDMALTVSNLQLHAANWTDKTALWLADNVDLDLTVTGTNKFSSASGRPGILVGPSNTLTVGGDGMITVNGGESAAGIGGSNETGTKRRNGAITINGGYVVANGGKNAAGIGGAQTSIAGGAITINGGVVIARGGQYGAAIGGGYTGFANVTITGGTVFPTAGSKAYAIGDGYKESSGPANNIFGLAAIYTTSDKVHASAKNSAGNAVFPISFDMGLSWCQVTNLVLESETKEIRDLWTDEDGYLTLWLESTGGAVRTVTVTAVDENGADTTKSWGYRMDDEGRHEFSNDVLTMDGTPVIGGKDSSGSGWSYNASSTALVVSSGNHTIGGNSTNGTIRVVAKGDGVKITIEDLVLKTPKSYLSPFVVSNSCTLTLVGDNTIECTCNPNGSTASQKGSQYTAAIEVPADASIVIDGDGSLIASAGIFGAGIGSRGKNESAGSITINGGLIYATGGPGIAGAWGLNSGGGAGIGGGNGGGVASILITGGYVAAKGGDGACGIGGGNGFGPYLTNGTFRVTGGTVLAAKGQNCKFSDFVTANGNTVDVTTGESIVIDGGSVRPKNAIVTSKNPFPNPVNSNGVQLVYAIIDGLGDGEIVRVNDPFWSQYADVDLIADEDGMICVWGEATNDVRLVSVESPNIDGGSATFEISAATNTTQSANAGGEAPEYRVIGGVTNWCVVVSALPAGKRLPITGLDSAYTRGSKVSDNTGKFYIYLPDGEYDFTVGDYSYHASVAGAATRAVYAVGIRVNGVDASAEAGEGWTYNGTLERLTLESPGEYLISGTNTERRVSVCAAAAGVKVRTDRLKLNEASAGSFYLADETASLEYVGGTLFAGQISSIMTVSGGSLEANIRKPVAPSGDTAYCVTIAGLTRHGQVVIEDLEGLDGYDTSNIWANEYGEVYLYLPSGDYYFRVRDGDRTSEMIAIVDDEDAMALNFTPTGVYINGRDAARLRGDGWINEDGLVNLTSATNYVITGTNFGSAVTIKAEKNKTALELCDLVMTNEMMIASPIALGSGKKTQITIVLSGTNILQGVEDDTCGVEMAEATELTVQGDGFLEARGAHGGPGIGMAGDADPSSSSFTMMSGEVVAYGGNNSAGIGGGMRLDGVKTYIYGGIVTAQGGARGAGIGGGYDGKGATVTVTNGVVTATGGAYGAGIGGGMNSSGESLTVTDYGNVTATGGTEASGVGGGKNGAPGRYRQSGGTVVAVGDGGGADIGAGKDGGDDTSTYTTIFGGSLKSSSDRITTKPKDLGDNRVYCVTIPTGRPNFNVGAVMSSYNGYLLTGAVTDGEGKLYIWLPNGSYYLNIGRAPYRAVVSDADTVAEQWSVGVEVNGEDLALQFGEGWTYDLNSGRLSVFGEGCTVSGSNTTDAVFVQFTNNVSVVISNLVIETTSASTNSPFSVQPGASVTLTLSGVNSLASGATTAGSKGVAGVSVPYGATLSITNVDMTVALPDLDNINVTTNRIYDIEYDEYGNVVGTNKYIEVFDDGTAVTNDYLEVIAAITNYTDTVIPSILSAEGGLNSAAIGGGPYESHGTIEINGGIISATGCSGAGIGSGYFGGYGSDVNNATLLRQGEIRINGGVVMATGGDNGAGIGGGSDHSGGQITLSGGNVIAAGGANGAGIGGGTGASGYIIKISGGVVDAYGGARGAGIGGGSVDRTAANTEQCRITISGGQVTSIGGTNGAGIGSGYQCSKSASVNITGGTVIASGTPDEYGSTPDDIGVGGEASSATIYPLKIQDASVHALRHTNSSLCMSPAPSNGTERVYCVTVQTAVTNELVSVRRLKGYSEDTQVYTDENGKIYLWLPNGKYVFAAGDQIFEATVNGADTVTTRWFAGVTANGLDVSYVEDGSKTWAYDLGTKTLYVTGDCVISGMNTAGYVNILAGLTEEDEGGNTGTVECSFTISNLYLKVTSSTKASPITVKEGTVTVCLAGVNRLDATETDSFAGLNVVSPATLAITNLEENARLEVYSGEDAAAIGGNQNKEDGVNYTTGTICIRGGIIYAEAQDSGAGIGSGLKGTSGDISISGGRVEAHGGEYYSIGGTWCGAGIGGGDNATVSTGCKIAISGGTVEAYGGIRNDSKYAADIGAGYDVNSVYRVEITGGSVHPESDDESRSFTQSGRSADVIPRNHDEYRVYKVTLDGFTPNAKVDFDMSGYSTNDIYADADGKIYLWLANGVYYYAIGGRRFATKIEDGTVTTVEVPDAYGVKVDGVDVAELVGDVWRYDVFSRQVTVTNACVLSGTNTEGQVSISVDAADAFAITVSNLNLKVAADTTCSPIAVTNGTVTVCLVGTNTLDATRTDGFAGVSVASPATLVITNLEERAKLEASGGEYAAGIGGDRSAAVGTIAISGGIIEANGGNEGGAGIGGGQSAKYNDGAKVAIAGGTIRAKGGWYDSGYHAADIGLGMEPDSGEENYKIVFSGASTWMAHGSFDETGHVRSIIPVNEANARVYEATLSGFTPHAKVELEMPNYGTNEIYADSAGTIYLWLANGTYYVNANGSRRALRMASGTVDSRTLPAAYGVKVDGVDVVNLSGAAWNYDPFTDKLTLTADCTLSGTNTYNAIEVNLSRNLTVAVDRLSLSALDETHNLFTGGGTLTITNGTSSLLGMVACDLVIRGGSHIIYSASIPYVSNGSEEVNPVYLGGFVPYAPVAIEGPQNYDYGTSDIFADGSGRVYLWLPEGAFDIKINGTRYILTVDFIGNGTLESAVGVEVDGMDVAYGSGAGWSYDRGTSTLAITGDVTLSGTNTAGEVKIAAGADVTVSPERLVVAVGAGEDVLSGAGTVTVTNGTAHLTGNTSCPVKMLGGSLKFDGTAAVAFSNETDQVHCVVVSNLAPNVKVALSDLPAYYGTSNIWSDVDGNVYLWLPAGDWSSVHANPLTAMPPRRLFAPAPATMHTIAANGYRYEISISEDGTAEAVRGEPLELEGMRITGFAVEDGRLLINVTAAPDTWLYGFAEALSIHASPTLPIPDTEGSRLDLSGAEYRLESDGSATIIVPLADSTLRFFKIVK